MEEQHELSSYPVFKALTRSPAVLGVPMMPLLYMSMAVAVVALLVNIFFWALWPVLCYIMAQITKYDDKAFRILGLWVDTKFRNGNKKFWGASTYTPIERKKRRRS